MPTTPTTNDTRPRYARITEVLRAEIQQRFKPGQLLPTQTQLAERFETSLITIKRALDELRRLGLVESIRGKGTIVCRRNVVDARTGVSSWTDTMLGLGSEPQTAWNRIDLETGESETRCVLQLRHREKLVSVRRLRTLDGDPICLMTNQLPAAIVPGLVENGFSEESLYGVLNDRYGIRFSHADEEVSARAATPEERRIFGNECKTVIEVQRISFDADDRPIECAWLIAPSSRYTYRVRVTA